VHVRRATLADADRVADVLRVAFADLELFYTPAAFAATTPSAGQIRERFGEGPVWIAIDARRVVGTVAVVRREPGLYVRRMAVRPDARARGIARMLMREVENHAREVRAPLMYLSTTPFLYSAIRLYESLGFGRTGEPPHDLFGTPLFTMAKRLA
jgi:ribosomal protein S18 acetylase RimI-like enzyme